MMDDLRTLIVDDEFLSRVVLKRLLQNMGHCIIGEAADGEEAVRLARKLRPNLVFMDVAMPGLDGIEATRCITQMFSVPVIMVSSNDRSETIDQARKAGAIAYLKKPVMRGELRAAIEQIFSPNPPYQPSH